MPSNLVLWHRVRTTLHSNLTSKEQSSSSRPTTCAVTLNIKKKKKTITMSWCAFDTTAFSSNRGNQCLSWGVLVSLSSGKVTGTSTVFGVCIISSEIGGQLSLGQGTHEHLSLPDHDVEPFMSYQHNLPLGSTGLSYSVEFHLTWESFQTPLTWTGVHCQRSVPSGFQNEQKPQWAQSLSSDWWIS